LGGSQQTLRLVIPANRISGLFRPYRPTQLTNLPMLVCARWHPLATYGESIMDKLAYSISETAKVLSLGRTSVYALIAEGKLETFKFGSRRLVKANSIRHLVDGQA
jgi:excisionase family DNA binding protein